MKRDEHQLVAGLVVFIGSAGIPEVDAGLPELGLRPGAPLHRFCRKRILAGRVECEQAIGIARKVVLQRQRPPLKQVATDRYQRVRAVEPGLGIKWYRGEEIVAFEVDTPKSVAVVVQPAAEHEIIPWRERSLRHRRSPDRARCHAAAASRLARCAPFLYHMG